MTLKYDRETKNFHRQVILDYLASHSCAHCEETDVRCLEFNHLGNKKQNVSHMIGKYSIAEILKEIDKCEILCSNCHRKYTCAQEVNYKQRYYAIYQKPNLESA